MTNSWTMKYWIVADTHFGHDKLMELCGRPAGFSEKILKHIKNTVQRGDTFIHLGDVCIGNDLEWHDKLFWTLPNCNMWLIKGNHDRKSDNWYYDRCWNVVAEQVTISVYGKKIVFSHKPIADDGYDINIHGHFHNADFRSHEPELVAIKNDKQLLVAMEYNNYMPVNLFNLIKGR